MEEQQQVYHYSEIFYSIQGEGKYTGVPTAWLRFFLCNLQCDGFGQDNPKDPSTYDLPYKKVAREIEVNPLKYDKMEDLPVFGKGCDSSYSWSKSFKHLQRQGNASEIASRITNSMRTESNPDGTFLHPNGTEQHMCFTGGEPLMRHGQKAVPEILMEFKNTQGTMMWNGQVMGTNMPRFITFETNGTQPLTSDFIEFFDNRGTFDGELFFSISPKLESVSGEPASKAIKPTNLKTYRMLTKHGQLKFVMGTKKEQWDELESVVNDFRTAGVDYPVHIMPLGALAEQQEEVAGTVADMALAKGYHVAARVHCYLWGNLIGV
jgi:organic radical activating enzyme